MNATTRASSLPHAVAPGYPNVAHSPRALALWLLLTVGGGALVGLLSNGGDSSWYLALDKPAWTPPSWVFGPAWTTLYALMGVAAWLVWQRGGWAAQRAALGLFAVQLVVNFAWSPVFFNAQRPVLALVDIVVLWLLVALTIRAFAGVSRPASLLLLPYLVWVSYATALNAAIVRAN